MQHLYWFNPDNEMSIANGGVNYSLPANIAAMVNELAFLPAYLGDKGDYVLVPEKVNEVFLKKVRDIFQVDVLPVGLKDIASLTFDEIRPWGWSPRGCYVLREAIKRANLVFRQGEMVRWKDERRELYSRERALECLELLHERLPLYDPAGAVMVCRTIDEVRRRAMERAVVVKAPWSSSGRGVLMLFGGEITRKEEEIITGMLRRQGLVMVEDRLERVLDFAMEFQIASNGSVSYLGLSVFDTGKSGEYKANFVESQSLLRERVNHYLSSSTLLEKIRYALSEVLGILFGGKYTGVLGVDMMVYKTELGEYRVQPCVEINLRYNMGILALCLQRRIAEESRGIFRIRFSREAGKIANSVSEEQSKMPLVMENRLIRQGYVALTPVNAESRFVAELVVSSPVKENLK